MKPKILAAMMNSYSSGLFLFLYSAAAAVAKHCDPDTLILLQFRFVLFLPAQMFKDIRHSN